MFATCKQALVESYSALTRLPTRPQKKKTDASPRLPRYRRVYAFGFDTGSTLFALAAAFCLTFASA